MDDAAAREALLAPRVLGASGFYELGHSLDSDGPPLAGGASPAWVGEILRLLPCDHFLSPSSESFEARLSTYRPFIAEWTWVDAEGKRVRSFEVGDLPAEAEASLRALAQASGNQAIRARLFDVLWLRFGRREDATSAADSYLARLAVVRSQPFLNERFDAIGRSAALVASARYTDRLPELAEAFDVLAAHPSMAGDSALPLATLATSFGAHILTDGWAREALRSRLEAWSEALMSAAEGRVHHGHSLQLAAARWLGLLGRADEMERVSRHVVAWMVSFYGRLDNPTTAPARVREIRAIAESFGFGDLAEACRTILPAAVEASLRGKAPPGGFGTAGDRAGPVADARLNDSPDPASELRRLCLRADLLEFRFEAFDYLRPKGDEGPNAWPGKPKVWFRDGEPSPPPSHAERSYLFTLESAVRFHHLGHVEAELWQFLSRAIDRFDDATLFASLGGWPALGRAQASVLAVASERFARRDWASSGCLIATTFGAVVRARMAAAPGRPAPDPGWVRPEESLPSLLRRADVRAELGADFVALAEFVLCRPDCGPRLHHQLMHGMMDAERIQATDVLLLWLLLLRVICAAPRST